MQISNMTLLNKMSSICFGESSFYCCQNCRVDSFGHQYNPVTLRVGAQNLALTSKLCFHSPAAAGSRPFRFAHVRRVIRFAHPRLKSRAMLRLALGADTALQRQAAEALGIAAIL